MHIEGQQSHGESRGPMEDLKLHKSINERLFLTDDDWYHDRASFRNINQCLIQRFVRWAFLFRNPDLSI